MKKIFLLLSIIGTFALSSCSVNDDDNRRDNDTISEVFIVDNVNFIASGNFEAIIPLNPKIYASDVILVYRFSGVNALGSDIWEPIPTSYDFDNGDRLKYFFDHSIDDVVVYLESNFDPMLRQDYSLNQSIKVVIVPGYFSSTVDVNNHDAVMNALKDLNGGTAMPIEKIRL